MLDKIVGHISPFYALDVERVELYKILTTWRERARRHYDQATKQPDPGPSALVFTTGRNEQEVIVVAPEAPTPAKRGRPKRSGHAANIYLSRVRRLVRQAYRDRNSEQMTVAVIREFSPGLLEIDGQDEQVPNYPEKKLGARLDAFAAASTSATAHYR
jgi:hypothetical protein